MTIDRLTGELQRANKRIRELEYIVRAISQWDMLNPVRNDLVGDLGWLKKLVDDPCIYAPSQSDANEKSDATIR
jgi:hypothetical protein